MSTSHSLPEPVWVVGTLHRALYSCRVSAPSSPETPVALTRRARRIYRTLVERYPNARCELDFETPLQLLVATVMSAQTTDIRVNMVTPAVFSRYGTAADYASADRTELETMIQSTGFYRAKTDSLIRLGTVLVDRFGGEVPPRLKDLVTLPGVGRKTANVVLAHAFGKQAVVVDTHVKRLTYRIGLSESLVPEKVEQDIMAAVAESHWNSLCDALIAHGRSTCNARRPDCGACAITKFCPKNGVPEAKVPR